MTILKRTRLLVSIQSVMDSAKNSSYNEGVKELYRKRGQKWIRQLAKALCLEKKDYDVRWEAGGIAVSGDITLHHEKFYIQINEFGVYWRACRGRKDYTGGPNRWFYGFGGHQNFDWLCEEIKTVL